MLAAFDSVLSVMFLCFASALPCCSPAEISPDVILRDAVRNEHICSIRNNRSIRKPHGWFFVGTPIRFKVLNDYFRFCTGHVCALTVSLQPLHLLYKQLFAALHVCHSVCSVFVIILEISIEEIRYRQATFSMFVYQFLNILKIFHALFLFQVYRNVQFIQIFQVII